MFWNGCSQLQEDLETMDHLVINFWRLHGRQIIKFYLFITDFMIFRMPALL